MATKTLKDEFTRLVDLWRAETRGISNINHIREHEAHSQLRGLGPEAVPLALERLRSGQGQILMSMLLRSLTGVNPKIDPKDRGRTKVITGWWLEWGLEQGHIQPLPLDRGEAVDLAAPHVFKYEDNIRIGWHDKSLYMVINIDGEGKATYEMLIDQFPVEDMSREDFFDTLVREFGGHESGEEE